MYDKLLLILSERSIASNWVAYEVEKALDKEPEGIPNVLYPIRLDDSILTCTTQWAKAIKSTRHIGDFTQWENTDDYQKAFSRLLRALKAEAQKMEQQATKAQVFSEGFYHSPGWNRDYPRIQILPIKKLLHGVEVKMPPQFGTFKQAQKVSKQAHVHLIAM